MRGHLPVLPLLLTLVGAMATPIVALVAPRAANWLAVGAAAAAALAALGGLADVLIAGPQRYALGGWPGPWGIELVLDALSGFVGTVVAGVGAAALLAAAGGARRVYGDAAPTFHALALVALTGYLGIVVSGDLFNVFVFLEIAAISSYALVASGGGAGLVAAFRYAVLGTVGASFYLLGVALLYALTGSLNMADLAARLPALAQSPLLTGGAALVVVGLAIKMALFPLHGWLPDAYTHAPPPVAALLPAVGTKAAAYALARILLSVLGGGDLPLAMLLAWTGAVAVVVGGVLAARQQDARRLLAYSSVSQMGYIAIGLGLAGTSALAGAYLHMLGHALAKGALFIGVGALLLAGRRPALAALGLGPRQPVLGACLVVAALSMVGVPPALGFFSKWYLLEGAVAAGQPGLVGAILLGSLLALVYMYRLTGAVWFADAGAAPVGTTPRPVLAVLVILAVATLGLGLVSGPLVERILIPAAVLTTASAGP